DGRRQAERDRDVDQVLPRDERHDAAPGRAENLTHADLLAAAIRVEGRKAEQPEARDRDRDAGEGREDAGEALLRPVLRVEVVLEPRELKRQIRETLPQRLDLFG